MTDKEFRRLRRPQLIEIIYALQVEQQKLIEENKALEQRLNSETEELRQKLTGEKEELQQKLNAEKEELQQKLNAEKEELQRKLTGEKEELQRRLEEKETKIEKAGSIAEATIALNDIFEVAQKAADQYLEEIHSSNRMSKEKSEAIIMNAQKEAAQLVAQAELESSMVRQRAEADVQAQWVEFNEKVSGVLQAHDELKRYLNRDGQ